MMTVDKQIGSVLVVGGGIAGMQAALDCANSGFKVYLLEERPAIGGNMSRLDKTFPTNDCAMCMISPKLVEAGRHLNIEIIAYSDLESIEGEAGNFQVTVNQRPRYVDGEKCSGCGACTKSCPVIYKAYPTPPLSEPAPLDEADRAKVDPLIEAHRGQPGALMPVLKGINHLYNYLPEKVLRYAAAELEVPLSLIYRIATFYNAFSLTPRGRHVISLCTGTTCYVRGADKLHARLKADTAKFISADPADTRFTLQTVRCLGCCSLAPVMTIDGETFGNLKSDQIARILSEYE